jgi:hypothetical protein
MEYLYQKSLGAGSEVYGRLRDLDRLWLEICPSATTPFVLAIDPHTAETLALFPSEQRDLAMACGALPRPPHEENAKPLKDLKYFPMPIVPEIANRVGDTSGAVHQ